MTLWRKMGKATNGKRPVEFLSTHPAPETRIEALAKLAPEMMPYYQIPGERPVHPL